VSNFAEILRKKMFEKRLKAVDLAKGTNIAPSVISRYLSGQNQPSRDNIITIGNYLDTHPQALLSSSDDPESAQSAQVTSLATESLLGQIEAQNKLIKYLEKRVAELEEAKTVDSMRKAVTESKEHHAQGSDKTKNPTKLNKQMVGFMKKPLKR